MKFVFEHKPMKDAFDNKGLLKSRLNTLRRMMMSFEQMVNNTLPAMRVHLSEDDVSLNKDLMSNLNDNSEEV